MPIKKAAQSILQKVTKKTAKKAPKKAPKKTAKKAVKKAPKKAAKKKSTSKNNVRVMVCANEECNFWTTDGQVLNNLHDLLSAFEVMDEKVFDYHVTKEKNDFAEWVEHVLNDEACAHDLRKARKMKSARTAVVRHVRLYT